MKTALLSTLLIFGATFSQAQIVTYNIEIDSLVGLELTSGDICSAPFSVEEAKQVSIGNSWGGMWTSTNTGVATSVVVELSFTVGDSVSSHPTTLNGASSNAIDPGAAVNCANGALLSWTIDPASYNSGGLNTFLVDYSASGIINQIDNLPFPGDPYLQVTVAYDTSGVGINELGANEAELIKIVDLMGREVSFKPNTPLIYMYSDGTIERVFKLEE